MPRFLRAWLVVGGLAAFLIVAPAERGRAQALGQQLGLFVVQLAIEAARAFADITYEDIFVDPKLGLVTIAGLAVATPAGPLVADRVTVSGQSLARMLARTQRTTIGVSGLQIPLAAADLPDGMRALLVPSGGDTVLADLTIDLAYDLPSSRVTVTATSLLPALGRLELEARLRGLHYALDTDAPEGEVEAVRLRIEDGGVVGRYVAATALESGLDEAQIRAMLTQQAFEGVLGAAEGMAGLATEQASALADEVARAVGRLLEGGQRVTIALAPATPLSFEQIQPALEALDRDTLGLRLEVGGVTAVDRPALAAFDPSDPGQAARLARAYLDGTGVPQNYGRALELAQPLAGLGDPEATIVVATILADGLIGDADPERAYMLASLAAARGAAGAIGLAARLEAGLDAAALARAQADSLDAWRAQGPPDSMAALEVAAARGDIAAMRDLARAFANGDRAPRNLAEAYVWASLAAAAGDGIAAGVRDRIADAARAGVLPPAVIVEAQGRADVLWRELPRR